MSAFVIIVEFKLKAGRRAAFRKLIEALCVAPMQANGGTGRRRMQ